MSEATALAAVQATGRVSDHVYVDGMSSIQVWDISPTLSLMVFENIDQVNLVQRIDSAWSTLKTQSAPAATTIAEWISGAINFVA